LFLHNVVLLLDFLTQSKSIVFAAVGGFQSVTNALERLGTELGTIILRDTTVTSIQDDGVHVLHTDKDEAEFLPADLVVCNADLPYATKSLLNNDRPPHEGTASGSALPTFDWDDSFNFSSGVIAFHWSIKRSCDDLNTHNVFMVAGSRPQAELSWKTLRDNNGDVDETTPFNFYVHRASKTDPSAAPSGCDSIMVLVPCRTLLRDKECAKMPRDEAMNKYKEQFSDEVVSRARQAVFHRLAAIDTLKDLEKDIIDEVVDTPATWADQFNVGAGTPFALSHGFAQLSLTRPGPASAPVSNVLFCGASTRPGNGVPLVLIGAKQVAKKAISALQENQQHR
jgi:phytoene desaturase (3,4-didehydrolycopene-forming)